VDGGTGESSSDESRDTPCPGDKDGNETSEHKNIQQSYFILTHILFFVIFPRRDNPLVKFTLVMGECLEHTLSVLSIARPTD